MKHFGTKGPVSILTKKFGTTTTKKAEAPYKDNYVRHLSVKLSQNKLSRKFQFTYNEFAWCKAFLKSYDRFIQSLLDSVILIKCPNAAVRHQVNVGVDVADFQRTVTTFMAEFNNSFGPDAGISAVPVELEGLPSLVSCNPQQEAKTNFATRDLYFFYLARRSFNPNNNLFADSFMKHSPSAGTGALYVIINMGRGLGLKIFQVNEAALGLHNLVQTITVDYSGGPLMVKPTQFIIADTPEDYDDAYNKQAWLPLQTTHGEDLLSPQNSIFFRYSKLIWALDDPGTEVREHTLSGALYDEPNSSFCGLFNWESRTVKNNLFEYEFTTDFSKKGKDAVYVDDEGVCHCPITGYPLKCVLRSIDYKDSQTTERPSWP
jgi:hypothetical protein